MKLVIFKIDSEHNPDYAVIEFQKTGKKIEDLYQAMLEHNVDGIEEDEDEPSWQVTIHKEIEVKDAAQAQEIVQLIADLADDDWLGDYDKRKGCDYETLVVP